MSGCCWPFCTPPRGRHPHRDVFAFGMHLTDLTLAFRQADTDAMLAHASLAIEDFAGGTQLGVSLATRASSMRAVWSDGVPSCW